MQIIAVRHGETNENLAGIVQGQLYGTLSDTGLKQIVALAETLATETFDVCYCSDLERTRQTCDAIIMHHPRLKTVYDDRLRERSMKPLEGRYFADIIGWDWNNDKLLDHSTPEGETWADVINRVAAALNDMFASHPSERVLVVSHGGPMRAMRALLVGEPWETAGRTMIENCEVNRWEMLAPVSAANVR